MENGKVTDTFLFFSLGYTHIFISFLTLGLLAIALWDVLVLETMERIHVIYLKSEN
jgi:hypothetical protein